jgi:HPt (histidine-containing phosphotransfer) domain-containing protein
MARRDLVGAVDFTVLERMVGGDRQTAEEVLDLFVEQAALWSALLRADNEGWRDAAHTIRGAAAGIGAHDLAAACEAAEYSDSEVVHGLLDRLHAALSTALGDVAAYRHELALSSLKG